MIKKNLILIFLILLVLPLMSATPWSLTDLFGTGVIINTTISNSSMTFETINITLDKLVVKSNQVSLYNVSYINDELTINITTVAIWNNTNENLDSSKLPYLISESTFLSQDKDINTLTFGNGLSNTVSLTLKTTLDLGCPKTGDTIIYTSNSGISYTVTNYTCLGDVLQVSLTDFERATSSSSNKLVITYNKQPSGVGGGGSTPGLIGKSLGIYNISTQICNLTYESAQKETNKYVDIDDIIEDNNLIESWTTIRTYIDYWQGLCSDLLNKTLEPKIICNRIYFFILERDQNYTYQDILNLKQGLEPNITISSDLILHYIDNHYRLCYLNNYSKELPTLRVIKIFDLVDCSPSLGDGFFDWSIPIGTWHIGELSCSSINKLRYIIKIDKEENTIEGVRFYLIFFLIVLILIILFVDTYKIYKVGTKIKKLIVKKFKKD